MVFAKWNARGERKALAKVWSTGRSSRILKWNELCSVSPRLSPPEFGRLGFIHASSYQYHPKFGRVCLQKLWVCN